MLGCLSALELSFANRNSYTDRFADTDPNSDDCLVPAVRDSYTAGISHLYRNA